MSKGKVQPSTDRRVFPERTRYDQEAKRPVHEQVAVCGKCGHEEGIVCNGTALPPEALTKKFKQRGWDVAARRTNDICPGCVEERKLAKINHDETSVQEEPAMSTNVTPIREVAPVAVEPETPPVALTPAPAPEPKPNAPRQPSREDRRRIMAAVEGVYDVDKKCYVKGHSDKVLGQEMNVPWAWIAEIREQFYDEDDHDDFSWMDDDRDDDHDDYDPSEDDDDHKGIEEQPDPAVKFSDAAAEYRAQRRDEEQADGDGWKY